MGTVIPCKQRRNADLPPRWERPPRAAIFDPYRARPAQGFSLRPAAKALAVPRSTLPAWRADQESLVAHPATMTHAAMDPVARQKAGLVDGLIRLSVGIEALEDLRAEIGRASCRERV